MKKRKKVTKILENWDVFILFGSYKLRSIKRDTLGKLVKFKLSNTNFQTNFPEKSIFVWPKIPGFQKPFLDISVPSPKTCPSFFTGFQKTLPDMSSPWIRHVRSASFSSAKSWCTGIVRCPGLDSQTCLISHQTCTSFWHPQWTNSLRGL
jgi:hypothetical protein